MNNLGLGAFDAAGATEFRELTLPVSVAGDVIQVDVTVANVSDGAYDSQVVVDKIEERQLAVTVLTLNDIDNTPLNFLSASAHPYFNGNTRINGTISIKGSDTDALTDLVLEVIQGGAVVATATLDPAAQTSLIKPFGAVGAVQITTSQLLFLLPSEQASLITSTQDGTVALRVKATAASGQIAMKDFGSATQILVRYANSNRYGERDEDVGGDDWVQPSIKKIMESFSGILWGDMSNMNGGSFAPHKGHQNGNEADGFFEGYNQRNAATAATMISYLNDATNGSKIKTVFVTFQRLDTDPFWVAIKDVTLSDGRLAKDVIRVADGHTTHFHWVIQP
jgi:hypothetical protein